MPQLRDPLQALGPSLFLHILSHLPLLPLVNASLVHPTWHEIITSHTSTLFRPLAHSLGIEKHHLKALEAFERTTPFSFTSSWGGDPDEGPELEDPSEPIARVDWRGIVKAWTELQHNRKWGRAKEGWLTPGRNTVWRMKVDKEEKTLLTTSRLDGILVSDLETSEPLFEYVDVAPYSHMEFAKGFVIFNIGHDHRLEVHLTPTAVRRLPPSLRQNLPASRHSLTRNTGYSFTQQAEYTAPSSSSSSSTASQPSQPPAPPPRGHLTYFRTIRPPTDCLAFRARIDKENVEGQARAVLGTAGEEAVYIWDLEDEGRMETYHIPPHQRERPNYIEFDDDYIFLCGAKQVHVISRRTKTRILSFPEDRPVHRDLGSALYPLEVPADFVLQSQAFRGAAPIARAFIAGSWKADRTYGSLRDFNSNPIILDHQPKEFSACHYTSSDLFCTAKSGVIHVLRNYKTVLAIQHAQRRDDAVSANFLTIVTGDPVHQLATYGEHVAVSLRQHVIVFETSSLPSPPYDFPFSPTTLDPHEWKRPEILLTSLHRVHEKGLQQTSCLQMDRENVYLVYWALGEYDAGGVVNHETGERSLPPSEATSDFGLCVKKWDFGLRR
ncbi:hypothetical protein CI109_100845 [Kwoniella shandongensis]|uniref:Uncharacterized protein n=1 Tax=Kwoniella shandongensis TaxID=1734106 RepID=A0A5M6BRK1_9TREE|nr:uncharacterized protein CI109_006097 [Kwoniella shandongensis]KAA5525524.1 hypothetical protein CI109_006097 [Kwoniella shandongensis]